MHIVTQSLSDIRIAFVLECQQHEHLIRTDAYAKACKCAYENAQNKFIKLRMQDSTYEHWTLLDFHEYMIRG